MSLITFINSPSILGGAITETSQFEALLTQVERSVKDGVSVFPEHVQKTLLAQKVFLKGSCDPTNEVLQERIEKVLNQMYKLERAAPSEVGLLEVLATVPDKLHLSFGKNLVVVQLTTGCSVACPSCNFNALLAPRRHLSWDAVTEIIDRWGDSILRNSGFLYWASDPLDWQGSNGKTYLDILNYFEAKHGESPHTTTAIPKGKEEIAAEIWRSRHCIRISPSNANVSRLEKKGIVFREDKYEIKIDLFGNPGNSESHVITTRGENVDYNKNLAYKVGLNYDNRGYHQSIACREGTIITPDGAFNLYSCATTPLTPNGYLLEGISAESNHILAARTAFNETIYNLMPYEYEKEDSVRHRSSRLLDHQCLQGIYQVAASALQFALPLKKNDINTFFITNLTPRLLEFQLTPWAFRSDDTLENRAFFESAFEARRELAEALNEELRKIHELVPEATPTFMADRHNLKGWRSALNWEFNMVYGYLDEVDSTLRTKKDSRHALVHMKIEETKSLLDDYRPIFKSITKPTLEDNQVDKQKLSSVVNDLFEYYSTNAQARTVIPTMLMMFSGANSPSELKSQLEQTIGVLVKPSRLSREMSAFFTVVCMGIADSIDPADGNRIGEDRSP